MPQPNATNKLTIVISQRSSDGLYFQEKYVSGSNLRLETDVNGNLVGVPGGGASGRFTGSFSGSAQLTSLTASAIRIIGQPRPLVFANNSSQTISKNGGGDLSIVNNVSGGKVYVENSYFLEDDLVVPGDIAVNGGDITTTSTGTATVFNTNATTLNVGGAATTVSIGAATGTTTINNANTVVAGDLAVNGGDITTTSTGTATVFNTNATTLNVGGAATTVSIGAGTGTTTINNANTVVTGDLAVNGGDITTNQTSFNLLAGATNQITIGAATSKVYIPGTLRASVISESIIHITSSQVDIGDNIIRVNALYPFKQYAGLEAIDSGSLPRVTASILWNSETNTWFINHKNSNKTTSSYVIVGPKSTNFGSPKPLPANVIVKGTPGGLGNEITSSLLTDDGTTLTYTGTGGISLTKITGSSLRINGTSVFNGQVTASSVRVTGPVVMVGNNTTIGDATSDTLTVGATSNFTGPVTASNVRITGTLDVVGATDFFGNTTIGDATSDTLTVGATSNFTGPVTASSVRVTGPVVMVGNNTTIGDATSDTLTVGATSNFTGPVTASNVRISSTLDVVGATDFFGNVIIGDASSDTLTVNATSTFNAPVTFTQITGSISGSRARFGQLTSSNLRVNKDIIFGVSPTGNNYIRPTKPATSGISGYNLLIYGGDAVGPTDPGGSVILRGGYGGDGSGSVSLRDDVVIGDPTTGTVYDILRVYSKTTFSAQVTASNIRVTGPSVMVGNTTIGDATSDTLTVGATSKFNGPVSASIISSSFRSDNFVFNDLRGNTSTYVAGGSTNGRIPSSSLDRSVTGPAGLTLVTGSLRVDDQFLYVFTGLYWKRVSLSAFNI